ncbi:MAG: RNA methyltransferase, partial [Deltaproteobacteria bacterium]|nr:RNA methyltransferase [Deltaproteobacteria bacterium]
LRETLAAACIHATGYRGRRPLWDPFCGAGTLLLEGLAQARGVVPGAARSFAFEAWPSLAGGVQDPDAGALAGASVAANALVIGSDHDPHALEAARANATRAGLDGAIRWIEEEPRAVSAAVPRDAIVVCNPPYGKRLGTDRSALQAAYRALSEVLVRRRDLDAWVLTGSPLLVRAGRGLDWEIAASFSNRGVPVRLYHRR